MEKLFEEIMENCNHKKVQSICKKLNKKFSFKSEKDVENLCHLIYWLYILGKLDFVKKCIKYTHIIEYDRNNFLWSFINSIWGLEIRILRQESNVEEINNIIQQMDKNDLLPNKNETSEERRKHIEKRRNRFVVEDVSYQKQIEDSINDDDIKGANEWRFIALLSLIGDTETGFYPNLNNNRDKIEKVIENYMKEILKTKK
jgi:hypothetical protein